MSYNPSDEKVFTKSNLDEYLKELSVEFRKEYGRKAEAEIILIGGAAVLANYDFRANTTDVDAVIRANSSLKSMVNRVGDKHGLPNNWLNSDFLRTDSYSPKLAQYSQHYRRYGGLEVRTVSGEYLIAMKLCSGRKYKKDMSDIVGVLQEHKLAGKPIMMEDIDKAVVNLYGSWDKISEFSKSFIKDVLQNEDYENVYLAIKDREEEIKEMSLDIQEKQKTGETNLDLKDILEEISFEQFSEPTKAPTLDEILESINQELEQDDAPVSAKNEINIDDIAY